MGFDRGSESAAGFEGLAKKKSSFGSYQNRYFWINNSHLNYGPDKKSVKKAYNLEDLVEVSKTADNQINAVFRDATKLNFKVDSSSSADAWVSAIQERHEFYANGGGHAAQEGSFNPLPAPSAGAAVTHESAIAAVDEVTAKAVEEMEEMKEQAKEAAGGARGVGALSLSATLAHPLFAMLAHRHMHTYTSCLRTSPHLPTPQSCTPRSQASSRPRSRHRARR